MLAEVSQLHEVVTTVEVQGVTCGALDRGCAGYLTGMIVPRGVGRRTVDDQVECPMPQQIVCGDPGCSSGLRLLGLSQTKCSSADKYKRKECRENVLRHCEILRFVET